MPALYIVVLDHAIPIQEVSVIACVTTLTGRRLTKKKLTTPYHIKWRCQKHIGSQNDLIK
jgi:hypothetical protein